MASDSYDVKVYIYDISKGMARAMSQAFLGKQLDGIWHTGIVVYGQEFYYGGTDGIECCPPGGTILGQPDQIHNLGETQIPYDMFVDYLGELSQSTYRPNSYHLLDHNCNTFSSEVAQFLTGRDIPAKITGLPAEVLSTPFGQMIKPFIDSMSVQPTGGHALFPQAPPSAPSSRQSKTQAPSSSRTAAHSSTQSSKQQTNSQLQPFIFNLDTPDEAYWTGPSSKISSIDQTVIREVYEFLSSANCTWSLGRDHMIVIHRLVLDCELGCETCALQVLSRLVTKEDIVQMLLHDQNSTFPQILNHYENFKPTVNDSVIKMLTNCCSSPPGCQLLLHEKNSQSVSRTCVSALLGESIDVTRSAVALTYNLTFGKLSEEMELELGSAILNCVEKDLDEPSAYHVLQASLYFIKNNQEVKGLARILGIDFERLRTKSERVASVCGSVTKLL